MSNTVFIAARAKARLRALKLAVRIAGMTTVEVVDRSDRSLAIATQDAMRNADYVLIVWDTTLLPGSLLFEAGLTVPRSGERAGPGRRGWCA